MVALINGQKMREKLLDLLVKTNNEEGKDKNNQEEKTKHGNE